MADCPNSALWTTLIRSEIKGTKNPRARLLAEGGRRMRADPGRGCFSQKAVYQVLAYNLTRRLTRRPGKCGREADRVRDCSCCRDRQHEWDARASKADGDCGQVGEAAVFFAAGWHEMAGATTGMLRPHQGIKNI
jgi:hypothetical protein